jgi:hypothetical protein
MENGQTMKVGGTEAIVAPSGLGKLFEGMPEKGNVETKEENTNNQPSKEEQEKLDKEEQERKDLEQQESKPDDDNEFESDGKTKKVVQQTKKEEENENENEDSIIFSVVNKYDDIDLAELEVEDNEEGLLSVVDKIVEAKEKKAEEKAIQSLFTSKPILKTLADHLDSGGSLMTLIQRQAIQDFEGTELKEDDDEGLERMYRIGLEAKGVDDDEIEDLINAAKDTKSLFKKGTQAKDFLAKKQKEIVDAKEKAEKEEYQEDLRKQKLIEEEGKKIIKTGKVNGLELSTEQQERLEKFNYNVDKEGKTERERKYDGLSDEQWLMLDALVMEDFKQLGAKKIEASTKKPIKLKLKKSATTVNLTSSNTKGLADGTLGKLGVDNVKQFFGK